MKAAVLKAIGAPLAIEEVPDPVLGTGEVIVDVAAARVLAYAGEIFSGKRNYPVELPMVPGSGAVARVRAVGPDATRLAPGDWVICDPTVRSRDAAVAPDIMLQGLIAPGPGAMKLHRHFHDGAFAEQMRVPTENAIPIGEIDAREAARWCALGTMLVPYGGLLAGGVAPGETVLVSGATGSFGGAGVAVALAMGAGRVVATGRNAAALEGLAARFGARVRPVRMTGDEAVDTAAMQAEGPIDCVLDLLPPEASPRQTRAAAMAVRPYGRVVLMGGVGMAGGPGLELPYPWLMRNCITVRGQWMFPPSAVPRLVALARSGLLRLDEFAATTFPLEQANEAVAHAAENAGAFRMTVITPR